MWVCLGYDVSLSNLLVATLISKRGDVASQILDKTSNL
jgi:hypothetical protein